MLEEGPTNIKKKEGRQAETKARKMRLELRVIGNRMKGDLEMPQVSL